VSLEDVSLLRRGVLGGVVAAAVGTVGYSVLGESRPTVSMLVAGSLNNAVENGLDPGREVRVPVEARGSAEVARLVAEGQKDPDVVSVSDPALFESPLSPVWYVEFATNSLVVAYDSGSAGGRRVAKAGAEWWYRALLDDEVALGRTDPDLDPLGYRTLFLFELATDYYDAGVDLRAAIPTREQVYPETQLVSQFETGSIDAGVVYRSMAEQRGYDYVELPPAIDLGDPAHADRYGTATYELPDGEVVRGGVVRYGSTLRRRSPAVEAVFERHTTGDYLSAFGFRVPENYPRYIGDVPDAIRN